MIDDPIFYGLAVVAVLINAIGKSGFGGGIGVLSVPLLSLVIPTAQAAAIMLPLLCLMDLLGFWHYKDKWDFRNVAVLLPAALIGVLMGVCFFRYLQEGQIRIMVGLIAILFSANYFLHGTERIRRTASVGWGTFLGMIAGFVSFGIHAGGPPVSMYLLPQKLDKAIFVGTTVVLFAIVNQVKLIPYAMMGQLSTENLFMSLILAPLAPLGIFLGIKLHHRIGQRRFYSICYCFLAIVGARLLWAGVAELLAGSP